MPNEKNLCGKTVSRENAYEVWQSYDGTWTWYVLKKYQGPDKEAKNPYARWHCDVVTPYCPNGEIGDVYIKDIVNHARMIKGKPDIRKVLRQEVDTKNIF